ncbi:hypothetical protein FOPG_17281 [Fusarium oxysporum f. sp. conglutinans race 2 54008]|uniref:Uncharacterized protein n=1 Tax=Fusarium oxysporum f. sp. conglutinans race 2 54008 TaxID=1089457 RepID=X0GT43_FUSOX|nr:hypothetical protein FOPG_17281 [Fusarium oxysporum f. sp. conglutinans race 2 54008]
MDPSAPRVTTAPTLVAAPMKTLSRNAAPQEDWMSSRHRLKKSPAY